MSAKSNPNGISKPLASGNNHLPFANSESAIEIISVIATDSDETPSDRKDEKLSTNSSPANEIPKAVNPTPEESLNPVKKTSQENSEATTTATSTQPPPASSNNFGLSKVYFFLIL